MFHPPPAEGKALSASVLGIDLGTTNSLVAIHDGNAPLVLTSFEGERLLPSAVAFTDKGELLVGEHAKRQAILNPRNTVLAIKRLIGRKFYTEEVQRAIERSTVPIRSNERGDIVVSLAGKDFSPEEISAILLRRLREVAEDHLQREVRKAVVTVPAYFNFSQREATRNAGRIAHLEVVRVLSEPTAAAIAFGLGREGDRMVAVYDLGGGTFDVSLMEIQRGTFRVRAVSGHNHLGGNDFDDRVAAWILREWEREHGIDLTDNRVALQRIREAAEFAKRDLSLSPSTNINIPFLAVGLDGQPRHFARGLDRARFEEMVADLIDGTFVKCEEALRLAGLKAYDITDVILVGGQTRSPIVYERVARFWNKLPIKGVHPDEAVAAGAATLGAVLGGADLPVSLEDVTGFSLGTEVDGGRMSKVIPRNTPIPVKVSRLFTTFHDDQEFVTVNVLQGESEYATYNHSLVKFDLAPIAKSPAGNPDIEVEFAVDADGIVAVTATDKKTGKAQAVRITDSNILSIREVERLSGRVENLMVVERNRRDLAQLKNHAIYLVGRVNAFMVDQGPGLGEIHVANLTHAISELERVAAFDNPALLDAARRVIEHQQQIFLRLVSSMRANFEVKPLG